MRGSPMKERKGIMAILYKGDNPRRYAVFERNEDWHGFELLKGGVEEGETTKETALREVMEEAGIELDDITASDVEMTFVAPRRGEDTKFDFDIFYAKLSDDAEIVISEEHIGVEFLEKDEAIKKLSFENLKKLLEKVDDEIGQDN